MVNALAYRAVALDFDLWSRTSQEIQLVYLDHFTTLLQTSRYRIFNGKQRLTKLGVAKKVLFAIQANWYKGEMAGGLIEVLRLALESNFSNEEAIKPVVSYLAANLHESMCYISPSSPYSDSTFQHLQMEQLPRTLSYHGLKSTTPRRRLSASSKCLLTPSPSRRSTPSSSQHCLSLASASYCSEATLPPSSLFRP